LDVVDILEVWQLSVESDKLVEDEDDDIIDVVSRNSISRFISHHLIDFITLEGVWTLKSVHGWNVGRVSELPPDFRISQEDVKPVWSASNVTSGKVVEQVSRDSDSKSAAIVGLDVVDKFLHLLLGRKRLQKSVGDNSSKESGLHFSVDWNVSNVWSHVSNETHVGKFRMEGKKVSVGIHLILELWQEVVIWLQSSEPDNVVDFFPGSIFKEDLGTIDSGDSSLVLDSARVEFSNDVRCLGDEVRRHHFREVLEEVTRSQESSEPLAFVVFGRVELGTIQPRDPGESKVESEGDVTHSHPWWKTLEVVSVIVI